MSLQTEQWRISVCTVRIIIARLISCRWILYHTENIHNKQQYVCDEWLFLHLIRKIRTLPSPIQNVNLPTTTRVANAIVEISFQFYRVLPFNFVYQFIVVVGFIFGGASVHESRIYTALKKKKAKKKLWQNACLHAYFPTDNVNELWNSVTYIHKGRKEKEIAKEKHVCVNETRVHKKRESERTIAKTNNIRT